MRRFLLICVLLVLIMPMNVHAQGGCGIDLEAEIGLLVRAQREADMGNEAVAISLLQKLEDDIAAVSERCGNIFVLLPNEYTTPDELLSFRYPNGWVADVLQGEGYVTASSRQVLNLFNDDPNFNAGDYFVALVIAPVSTELIMDDPFLAGIDDIQDQTFGSSSGASVDLMFGDRVAMQRTYGIDEFDVGVVTTFVDFSDVDETVRDPAVIGVIAVGATEELSVLATFSEAIASSVEYPPVASLRAPGEPLDNLVYGAPIPLDEVSDELDPRSAVLSPDGTKIASFGEQLCVHNLDTGITDCQELERRIRTAGLFWSPDSRYIAFHEDFVRTLSDSDVYLYDTTDSSVVKLTDGDNDSASLISPDDGVVYLDGSLTWGDDGQIYMFRAQSDGSGGGIDSFSNLLVRVDPQTGDIVELADLTGTLPVFSVFNFIYYLDASLAVSPDLSQIAFSVRAARPDEPINGVWVYNLQTDTLEQLTSQADFAFGVPEDYAEDASRLPYSLVWDNESVGLYVYVFSTARSNEFPNLYYVDVNTGDATVYDDYSDVTVDDMAVEDDDGLPMEYQFVRSPVFAPNSDGIIFINQYRDVVGLSAVTISDGDFGETSTLVEPIEDAPIRASLSASVSRDGKVLASGQLFLPE